MLINYLKIAIRNIGRRKLFSLINIFGLAVGIASCMVIYSWVQDELSYDGFHSNADRVYRLERKWDFRDMHGQAPMASGPWGEAMLEDYPEIKDYVRLKKMELSIKDHRNMFYRQPLFAVDNSIFHIFDFTLVKGNPKSALDHPFSIVLTRELAARYLGTEDSIGKTLTVDWFEKPVDFRVTGILGEVPENSHIQFDILISISSFPGEYLSQWLGGTALYTYVLLADGINAAELEKKFPRFLKKYMVGEFTAYFGNDLDINDVFQVKLKPLADIHLNPSKYFEIGPQGNENSVYIFSVIAFLVLILACINFMNLSTARANKRAREVGLRKTIGATRRQLLGQFLGESMLLAFLAMFLAVFLIQLFLPLFNVVSGKTFDSNMFFQGGNSIKLLVITLVTGLLAGLYPAFYLTAFRPVKVLKGNILTGTGKSLFKTGMVIFQFAVSIALIIGTMIIYKQMNFIQNKILGFDKENIVIVPVESNRVRTHIDSFRNKIKRHPRIKFAAVSSNVPGDKVFSDTMFKRDDTGDVFNLTTMDAGYEFASAFKLEMAAGRWYSKEYGTDRQDAFILNEKAIKDIGWQLEEAVGKKLIMTVGENESRKGTVIGVVKNFNLQSLHFRIEPLAILLQPAESIRYISLRILPEDIRETVEFIREKWRHTFPGEQFAYGFQDNKLNVLYKKDEGMRDIVMIFSVLSILIACLGLFGLAAFTAEDRTREIGIRKVIGASSGSIMLLLSREFSRCVGIAVIIAWPVSYYVMSRWLQDFAFRTEIGVGSFVFAGILAFVIAQLTVGYQSVKAAYTNPVDSLRYE